MPENGGDVQEERSLGLRADMAPLVELLVQLISTSPYPGIRNWAANVLAELALAKTQESRTDSLTQLPNPRGLHLLFERLVAEVTCASRNRQNVSDAIGVISLDLKGFGGYNQLIGWDAASLLLVDFARILEANLRRQDVVARQGGDEFIALVPMAEAELTASGHSYTYESLLEALLARIHAACESYNHELNKATEQSGVFTPLRLHARTVVLTREELQRRFENDTPITLADVIRLADPKHRRT